VKETTIQIEIKKRYLPNYRRIVLEVRDPVLDFALKRSSKYTWKKYVIHREKSNR
jgi:hypothetical protein